MSTVWTALLRESHVLIAAAVGLLSVVALGEALKRSGLSSGRSTRRLIHFATGIFAASTPALFETAVPVYVLAIAFVVLNATAARHGWLSSMHGAAPASWGTVAFPLALLPALWAAWTLDPTRVFALQVSFLILAVADPVASTVGQAVARPGSFRIGGTEKSVLGSAAFFSAALIVSGAALAYFRVSGFLDWTGAEVGAAALLAAGVTTVVEALGARGWDNFFIVIGALVLLIFFDDHPDLRLRMLLAAGVGITFGIIAYRLRFLDASGAAAGGLLALSVIGLGGWSWTVPAFTFFVLSSVLSKVRDSGKGAAERLAEKGSVRDAGQVYANGAIAWTLLLIHVAVPLPVLYWGFLGAWAAAAADTWGTELGTLVGGRPVLITSGELVPPGTSGAVSGAGTLGAALGAGVVVGSALIVPDAIAGAAPFLLISASGLLGSLVDSLAGATVQAGYRDPDAGVVVERSTEAGRPLPLVRGFRAVTNDRVNLLCTTTGAAAAVVCFHAGAFVS